jgi:hypothetical protein
VPAKTTKTVVTIRRSDDFQIENVGAARPCIAGVQRRSNGVQNVSNG